MIAFLLLNSLLPFLCLLTVFLTLPLLYLLVFRQALVHSCLYYGRVRHTRLKGGAVHKLDYPLFFSFVDLEEIDTVKSRYWPIFRFHDSGHRQPSFLWRWLPVFCSLDSSDHLKKLGFNQTLIRRVKDFVISNCSIEESSIGRVKLLTHLTYFGYCFNPVSFYYIYEKANTIDDNDDSRLLCVIAEVSNTPWIEQHPYALHETAAGVSVERTLTSFTATFGKDFHVSPFMEMDYTYIFKFELPGERIAVHTQLNKRVSKEVYFTAHFNLSRMKWTPQNLLYVLIFYPLHTRMIQIWIHWEALLLYLKGVPTYEHPNKTDVDFGFGITGKRLGIFLYYMTWPIFTMLAYIMPSKSLAEVGVNSEKKIR